MFIFHDINNKILSFIENNTDVETGEVLNLDQLALLELQKEEEVEQLTLAYKDTNAVSESLDKEIKTLQARKKQADNTAESLKNYIDYMLQGQKFETARVKIGYRKSSQLIVEDTASVPYSYLKFTEPEVDKKSLKKAIEGGLVVQGSYIQTNNNIQIK